MLKQCTKCGRNLGAERFSRDSQKQDGLRPSCKECERQAKAVYRDVNRETLRLKASAYYAANRELVLARQRSRWPAINSERRRERGRLWMANFRAQRRLRFGANPVGRPRVSIERKRVLRDLWYKRNAAKVKAGVKAWVAANPERTRETQRHARHKRRILIKGLPIERVAIDRLGARDRWRCGICGVKVTRAEASVDHILPISKGGGHTYANTRIAHRLCNVRRGNRGAAQLRLLGD